MTVTYSAQVATCGNCGMGNFKCLLFRWRGSIYKLVILDMIVYCASYAGLSCFYRFYVLQQDRNSKTYKLGTDFVKYCNGYYESIPLSFILGFYIGVVMSRWWSQFTSLPWPDAGATLVSTHLHGNDDRGRMMRRTLLRYVNLSFVLTMRLLSTQAKKRFPSMNHLVEAGFLLPHELAVFDALEEKTKHIKYWVPLVWGVNLVARARREGRMPDDMSTNEVIKAFMSFRAGLGDILTFDWATIPLMYTQTVTLAVYLYFVAALVGKQFLHDETDDKFDFYVPIFLFFQFFFYVGWTKVAETLANPFGEDDDDFETNWLIDRNLQVSYLIVDEMHAQHPPMLRDQYWDEVGPIVLPYTKATAQHRTEGLHGSAEREKVQKEQLVHADDIHRSRSRLHAETSRLMLAGSLFKDRR